MPDPPGYILPFKTMEPSWTETIEAIEAAVKQVPAGTWIFGQVGHDAVMNPAVTRFALDPNSSASPRFAARILRSWLHHQLPGHAAFAHC